VTLTTTTTTTTTPTPTQQHRPNNTDPTPTGRTTETADNEKKNPTVRFYFWLFFFDRPIFIFILGSYRPCNPDIVCRTCRGLVTTSQRDASAAADHHRNNTRCCIGYLCKSRLLQIKPPEGTSRSFDPRKTND
jgi:hypothetical protein